MQLIAKILIITLLLLPLILEAKTKRSYQSIKQFKQQNPCPANGSTKGKCPGYIIDHVQPLKRGGADHPANMQWQTKEDAKAKDKWE